MHKTIKIIGRILGTVLLLYLIVSIVFYVFQKHFIFQSESLPKDYAFTFDQKFEEYSIPTHDGETLNALLFKAPQPRLPDGQASKGLILYFHGNAGNLQRWGQYAIDFTSLGYDILITDYRGYGKSTGTPDEHDFYKDAQTVLRWSQVNIKHERLIIYGRSLGSAVASNLATNENPDLLILETPLDELQSVLYFLPARYDFSNTTNLPNVKCATVIIHGTDDEVVPLSSALRLKPLLKENDQLVIIEGGSHNDLRKFEKYHRTLAEVLD